MSEQGMDCIVVGGCADGALLKDVRMDAQYVELRRPEYIKPIKTPYENLPDIHHEKDVYEIHVIGLQDSDVSPQTVFGIAVIQDKPLTWAFTQLMISHVEVVTQRIVAAGLLKKDTSP